jgi:hypothetical protein
VLVEMRNIVLAFIQISLCTTEASEE